MGLLDSIVDRSFRDDRIGRVVVFGGDLRKRGYVVRSKDQELKIRSFVKMFIFAQLSIQLLGLLLANAWSTGISHTYGRPAAHIFRLSGIFLGIYFLVVGLPMLLLWRSYKRERFSFVSAQDEVLVTSKFPRNQLFFRAIALGAFAILILMGIMLLIRFK
jgi:hypothetical protein